MMAPSLMKYPLFRPPELTGKYLGRVFRSRWLTTGPECERLRLDLANRFDWDEDLIVLGSSATACWQAWLDVTVPHRVAIIPATWPGMLHAIKTQEFAARPWSPTGCTVVTQIGGAAAERPNRRYCEHGDKQFLDACHSWQPDPAYDASLVSFYPTKLVPGAEGGALFLAPSQRHLASDLEMALNCGQVPAHRRGNAALRSGFGRKGNMTDVQAALNREALELSLVYIEQIQDAWYKLHVCAQNVSVLHRQQDGRAYLFQVMCPPERVQDTRKWLAKRGIPTAWNFPPAGLITVPCFPGLTWEQAEDIIRDVKECL